MQFILDANSSHTIARPPATTGKTYVQNLGPGDVYISSFDVDSPVDDSSGLKLEPGERLEVSGDPIYLYATQASTDVRYVRV